MTKQKQESNLRQLIYLIKTSADWSFIDDAIQLLPLEFDFSQKLEMDNEGNTLLTLAAKTGEYKVIESLLKKGAGTDSVDDKGNTALHIAIERDFI